MPTGAESYDIDRVRAEWVGRVVAFSRGRYPVEYDPIRRYCHMIGDTNPLFLDPAAAETHPHGGVVVPLPLVPYFAGQGPWPRADAGNPSRGFTYGVPVLGDRGINMGVSWDYLEPVRVGDRLRAEVRVIDVFIKPIRLDPLAVWIVTGTRISRDDGVLAVTVTNTVLVHRSADEVGA